MVYAQRTHFFGCGHLFKLGFTRFLQVFTRFFIVFSIVKTYLRHSPYKYPSNLHHFSHHHLTLSYSPHLPYTTMCFHRWHFIKRCYFGNSRIVWTGNGEDNALQRSTVCLSVRLVCLGARFTIMVSFTLKRKQTILMPPPPLNLSLPFAHPFTFPSHQLTLLV